MEILLAALLEFLIEGVIPFLWGILSPRSEPQMPEQRPTLARAVTWAPPPPPPPPRQEAAPDFVTRLGKGTHCLVCGDPLEKDAVPCPKCATLHHEQCWDYVRGCALYGCRYVGRRRGA